MRRLASLLLASAILLPSPAQGSIPTSRTFGEWHVGGITSLSGVGLDDASAGFSQQHDDVSLAVRWTQGERISVSASALDCGAEDIDFDAGYSLAASKWRENPRATSAQVKADMQGWLKQIEFLCERPGIAKRFKFAQFDRAFEVFTGWVLD